MRLLLGFLISCAACSARDPAKSQGDTDPVEDTEAVLDWSPGDEIPGWPDYECDKPGGENVFEVELPEVTFAGGTFWDDVLQSPEGIGVSLQDCTSDDCDEWAQQPSVTIDAATKSNDCRTDRGIGVYDGSWEDCRASRVGASALFGQFTDNANYAEVNATSSTCISSFRPDRIAGFSALEIAREDVPFEFEYDGFESLILVYPFDVMLADHAGLDKSQPWDYTTTPDEILDVLHIYNLPYEDAWPWDQITDETIRDAVYERYTPYNAE